MEWGHLGHFGKDEVRVTSETGGHWAWLAGFFEGEGSIVPQKSKWTRLDGTERESTKVYLYITNTDKDVLERAQQIAGGVGRLEQKAPARNAKPSWKTVYRWNVQRRADVDMVMRHILPWLGERRTKRWHEVVAMHAEGARDAS